jgi:hypothetical protein
LYNQVLIHTSLFHTATTAQYLNFCLSKFIKHYFSVSCWLTPLRHITLMNFHDYRITNVALINWECPASNDRAISEQWTRKDLKGNGCGLI